MGQRDHCTECGLEDFVFNFLLGVFQSIFGLKEPLFRVLQWDGGHQKMSGSESRALAVLKAARTDETFSSIYLYDETVQTVREPVPRRKYRLHGWEHLEQGVNQHQEGDKETVVSLPRLYFQIADSIVLHMTRRFADMEHLSFFRVRDNTSFASFCKPATFPSSELAQLIKTYPLFDEPKLRNELCTLYNKLFHKPPGELIQLLIEDDLQGTLSKVYKLLQLMILTIPATSTSAECSFSCLKRIKTSSFFFKPVWTGQTCQPSQNIH